MTTQTNYLLAGIFLLGMAAICLAVGALIGATTCLSYGLFNLILAFTTD